MYFLELDLINGIISSSIGACIGAFVGGCCTLAVSKWTFNKETRKDIGELLLELRENRKKLHNIYSEVENVRNQEINQDEIVNEIKKIISNPNNILRPVITLWEQNSALVYTECKEEEYNRLKILVYKITELVDAQSGGRDGIKLYDPSSDALGINLIRLYNETELLFQAMTNKYIVEKLKINR